MHLLGEPIPKTKVFSNPSTLEPVPSAKPSSNGQPFQGYCVCASSLSEPIQPVHSAIPFFEKQFLGMAALCKLPLHCTLYPFTTTPPSKTVSPTRFCKEPFYHYATKKTVSLAGFCKGSDCTYPIITTNTLTVLCNKPFEVLLIMVAF